MGNTPFAKLKNPTPQRVISQYHCPECGEVMIERRNKYTGELFYGCSSFPDCTGTRNAEGESKYDRDHTEELDGHLRFGNDRS